VGNLIDRVFYGVLYADAPLFYGRVVDFIDFDFFDFSILGYQLTRWPVFNIADAAVTVGVIMLLIFHRATNEDRLPVPVTPYPGETGMGEQTAPETSGAREGDG
jgi:signal peptidase II